MPRKVTVSLQPTPFTRPPLPKRHGAAPDQQVDA